MKAENVEDERVSTRKYFWMTGTKRGTKQNKYLEDQDFYASFPWLANWKSLDCNNMLTVDKSQFLDQQKYYEADKFSNCDINSNRIILSLTV